MRKLPFHVLINNARAEAGESIRSMSKILGLKGTHLRKLEKGKSQPTLSMLQKILPYYGINFDEIHDFRRSKHEKKVK